MGGDALAVACVFVCLFGGRRGASLCRTTYLLLSTWRRDAAGRCAKKKVQKNGSVILNLASEHTQLTTYLKIGSRGGGGRWRRGRVSEAGRTARVL